MAEFSFSDNLFSMNLYAASSLSGSIWFIPFFSTYGVSFVPLSVGYRATKVFDSGWMEYFGGQGMYWVFLILVRLTSDSNIIV
jgi:NADH-ubiquinone oxidoreductase chain 5